MNLDGLQQDMRDRLRPDPGTERLAEAVFAHGLGASNGIDHPNHLVFSILLLDGNPEVAWEWTGNETVMDSGGVYVDRMAAYEAADALAEGHDGYALVYHRNEDPKPQWSVFIGFKKEKVTA